MAITVANIADLSHSTGVMHSDAAGYVVRDRNMVQGTISCA